MNQEDYELAVSLDMTYLHHKWMGSLGTNEASYWEEQYYAMDTVVGRVKVSKDTALNIKQETL